MRTETGRPGPSLPPGPRQAPPPTQLTLEIKVQYIPSALECLAVHGACRCGAPAFREEGGGSQTLSPDRHPQGSRDLKEQGSAPLLC